MSDRLRDAPIGTKAPAISGGWWCKMPGGGWKWNGPDGTGGTFPGPGADWTSELRPPHSKHCIHCRALLTAEEIEFYDDACEACERKINLGYAEDSALVASAGTAETEARAEGRQNGMGEAQATPVSLVEALEKEAKVQFRRSKEHFFLGLQREHDQHRGQSFGLLFAARMAREAQATPPSSPPPPDTRGAVGGETLRDQVERAEAVLDGLSRNAMTTSSAAAYKLARDILRGILTPTPSEPTVDQGASFAPCIPDNLEN